MLYTRLKSLYQNTKCLHVLCLVVQSCLTLCDPMDYSPPGSSCHGDSLGKNTGMGCQALLQGIFPTQGSNPCLLHYRWIHYCWATGEAQIEAYPLLKSYWDFSVNPTDSFLAQGLCTYYSFCLEDPPYPLLVLWILLSMSVSASDKPSLNPQI